MYYLDRTAQEVAKLTYKDMLELLTMKSQWRREMEKMMAERELKDNVVVSSPSSSTSSTSSTSSSSSTTSGDNNTNNSTRLFNPQEICI